MLPHSSIKNALYGFYQVPGITTEDSLNFKAPTEAVATAIVVGAGAETMAGVAVHRARKPPAAKIMPVQHVT